MNFLVYLSICLIGSIICLPIDNQNDNEVMIEQQEITPKGWCCAVDVPYKPVYSWNGDLIGYEPQPCPSQYFVCCNGFVNVQGTCMSYDQIQASLPYWQQQASSLGVSTLQYLQQIGVSIIGK